MLGFLICAPIAVAEAPILDESYFVTPETPKGYRERAYSLAVKEGVSPEKVVNTIQCESEFNPDAVGDGGTSFGLSQIHLPSHPSIKREQALNPDFAIHFIVSEFKAGRASKWTCYRKLYL